ncbi:hypothetical protein ILYODFUR_028005 [Ilyodon furcidens]|uniref:Uncharacterized protein n=1 Tax=Ilyodon furcidens TaxID=33524 RepID=A0ABV0SPU6_9TELE
MNSAAPDTSVMARQNATHLGRFSAAYDGTLDHAMQAVKCQTQTTADVLTPWHPISSPSNPSVPPRPGKMGSHMCWCFRVVPLHVTARPVLGKGVAVTR